MKTEAKALYSAIVLGATGNVGGRIVQLLIENPLCKKVVVVTRRKADAFADPKVSEVVVNSRHLTLRGHRHKCSGCGNVPRADVGAGHDSLGGIRTQSLHAESNWRGTGCCSQRRRWHGELGC